MFFLFCDHRDHESNGRAPFGFSSSLGHSKNLIHPIFNYLLEISRVKKMSSKIDKIWFEQNIEKLEAQYQGQFIAILNEEVIAHTNNSDEISKILLNLKKSGKLKGFPIIVRASKKNPASIKIPSIY